MTCLFLSRCVHVLDQLGEWLRNPSRRLFTGQWLFWARAESTAHFILLLWEHWTCMYLTNNSLCLTLPHYLLLLVFIALTRFFFRFITIFTLSRDVVTFVSVSVKSSHVIQWDIDVCVSVGDSGEIWLPAEDGKPGEGMEKALVHPEEWRDPVL